VYREDGSKLADADRRASAEVLHAISVRPLAAPARPQMSAHTAVCAAAAR
jgi:hypothetical protein